MEDLDIRRQEDDTEVVEFREGPTKTRGGGLTIRRRNDGGRTDYDEIDKNQRKELSHIISGYKEVPNENIQHVH